MAAAYALESGQRGSRFDDGVYHNRYLLDNGHGLGRMLRWEWERLWAPKSERVAIPPQDVPPALSFVQHNRTETSLTWIGHSTLLLQIDGLNILTDPMFSDYASPLPPIGPKRLQPPGLRLDQLPHIDLVLISHNHYDHMDLPSLRRLAAQPGGAPLFYVPAGNGQWLQSQLSGTIEGSAQKIFPMNWDETRTVHGRSADLEIHFLAVQHWSARTLWDRDETLWGSWALIHPRFRFWFSGDLGYSHDTADIGAAYGPFDLAAIDIGAYEPRWFMARFHVNPAEAVQVMRDVRARQAIGIHWGTFQLSDEPIDQPPKDLAKALEQAHEPSQRFLVLNPGETRHY